MTGMEPGSWFPFLSGYVQENKKESIVNFCFVWIWEWMFGGRKEVEMEWSSEQEWQFYVSLII